MTDQPNKHGGKRPGAGRPQKYKERTVTVSARVPASRKAEIEEMIKQALKPG